MSRRIAISLGLAAVVFLIGFLAASNQFRALAVTRQTTTRSAMYRLRDALDEHRQTHKRFPATLAELSPGYELPLEDGWDRPFAYSVAPDGGYTILSLGRDGKRGGEGLDHDLEARPGHVSGARMTFRQFLELGPVDGFVLSSLASALLAFALGLVAVKRPLPEDTRLLYGLSVVLKLGIIACAAVTASFFMAILHISKH
jgi:hypothetical protein